MRIGRQKRGGMRMKMRVVRFFAIALFALGLSGAPVTFAQDATPTAAPSTVVVRTVLSQGEPASAPGHILQLVRFDIPAHTKLAVHTHPGTQSAFLQSGSLTYTVVENGTVAIKRAGAMTGTPVAAEILSPGQTTVFNAGDSWTETEGMVHFAENAGDEPVVILVASLFTDGAPASTIVNLATPAP